jgi:hypothetical protein
MGRGPKKTAIFQMFRAFLSDNKDVPAYALIELIEQAAPPRIILYVITEAFYV